MFKPHYGYCTHPDHNHNGEESFIVVKVGWCDRCNHRVKNEKKKAAGKKVYTGISKLREPTGEMELFEEIASEREWVDFVTGKPLRQLTPTQFMHVLPKALNKYPLFKLYKKNIVLGSDETHFKWDNAPRSELRKDPQFNKLFELEAELKEEYEQLKNRQ